MNAPQIAAWLMHSTLILDGTPAHNPIPRPSKSADVIATAAAETSAPLLFAAWLDVLAAHESGYRTTAAGDCPGLRAGSLLCTRERGAHACGAWQGLCAALPAKATPLDQARLAVRDLTRALDGCPDHPLWQYARGRCERSRVAELYEADVAAKFADGAPVELAETD